MTIIRLGPHTELNIFTIEGNTEPDRQTPMWGRGRIDHFGLQAADAQAFDEIRERLIAAGAGDGHVNDFGGAFSTFFRDPGRPRGRGPAHEMSWDTARGARGPRRGGGALQV